MWLNALKTRQVCIWLRNRSLFEVLVFSSGSLTCPWVRNGQLSSISFCCDTIKLKPTQIHLRGQKKQNKDRLDLKLVTCTTVFMPANASFFFCKSCFKLNINKGYCTNLSEWSVAEFGGQRFLCNQTWTMQFNVA